MGRIVSHMFVALDGVVEAPEQWHFPYFDDRMGEVVDEQFSGADCLLLGRATYDVFAASWPWRGSDVPFADQINGMPKVVVSKSLPAARWQNTTILRNLQDVAELKADGEGTIIVSGSPGLVRSLLRAGLLDELQLLVHPLIQGTGERLFPDDLRVPLETVSGELFGSGVMHLIYRPATKPE